MIISEDNVKQRIMDNYSLYYNKSSLRADIVYFAKHDDQEFTINNNFGEANIDGTLHLKYDENNPTQHSTKEIYNNTIDIFDERTNTSKKSTCTISVDKDNIIINNAFILSITTNDSIIEKTFKAKPISIPINSEKKYAAVILYTNNPGKNILRLYEYDDRLILVDYETVIYGKNDTLIYDSNTDVNNFEIITKKIESYSNVSIDGYADYFNKIKRSLPDNEKIEINDSSKEVEFYSNDSGIEYSVTSGPCINNPILTNNTKAYTYNGCVIFKESSIFNNNRLVSNIVDFSHSFIYDEDGNIKSTVNYLGTCKKLKHIPGDCFDHFFNMISYIEDDINIGNIEDLEDDDNIMTDIDISAYEDENKVITIFLKYDMVDDKFVSSAIFRIFRDKNVGLLINRNSHYILFDFEKGTIVIDSNSTVSGVIEDNQPATCITTKFVTNKLSFIRRYVLADGKMISAYYSGPELTISVSWKNGKPEINTFESGVYNVSRDNVVYIRDEFGVPKALFIGGVNDD